MVKIQFENNTFNDHAQAIGAVFDFSDSAWRGIAGEVENAKRQAPPEKMTIALENLERAVRKRSKRDTAGVIRQFASVFTSTMFANIASQALWNFVQGFLS